jgi:hypothetical protein
LIESHYQTLLRADLVVRLQAVEKVKTEVKTADMITRMIDACSGGVRSDEIRRVYKVIEDEEFPDELVKRLFTQPAQLHSLYGKSALTKMVY